MAKFKHSKLKNTQILFELLTRQVAADTIRGVDSPALKMIRKFFKSNSTLASELVLYESLCSQSYKSKEKANMLIREVLKARKQISESLLGKQKYQLIKEIKDNYVLEDFLKTPLPNYKLYASICTLFESINASSPPERIVESKFCIVEHLTRSTKTAIKETEDPALEEYKKQNEDIRILAYKLLIENFNTKYQNLTIQQKNILKEYINNISNSDNLRKLLVKEVSQIKVDIEKHLPTIKDQVTIIKLKEVLHLTDKYKTAKKITENHILSVLMYMELLKEIKSLRHVKTKAK